MATNRTAAAPRRKTVKIDPSLSAFATSERSPFPDRYDLIGERSILAGLLKSGDPDPADPLFGRYHLFLEREQQFQQLQAEHASRHAADALVPPQQARQIKDLGGLAPGSDDTMSLHTAEAMRLFLGVSVKPGETGSPVAGGKRVAAALRALWSLSGNDNPYADWALIEATERITETRNFVATEQKRLLARLDELKTKGLSYSVLQSNRPAVVRLGFVSPYGFMIALLHVEVDHFARVVKSCQRRDLVSSREAHQLLTAAKHKCRSVFERVVYFQKYLSREELIALSRHDFLPVANDLSKKRVAAVKGVFGEIPKDIFTGKQQPRHTKRRVNLTEAELRLLDQVPLADEAASSTDAATALLDEI